jgi:hypothetical protein
VKRGGVVVLTKELALHVERVLNERGGVREQNDVGTTEGESALNNLAHSIAGLSRGDVTFDSAKRALFRVRTAEARTTDVAMADLILMAAEQPPWILRELTTLASTLPAATEMVEAYSLHVEEMNDDARKTLAAKLRRFSLGVIESMTDDDYRVKLVQRRTERSRNAKKRRDRQRLQGATA